MDYKGNNELMKKQMGRKIKEIRNEAGESMAQFGKRMKVSTASVYGWESGKSAMHEKNIDLLCQTYHISKDWLLGKDTPKVPESKEHMDRRNLLNHAMLFMSDVDLLKTEDFLANILDVPFHTGVEKENESQCQ